MDISATPVSPVSFPLITHDGVNRFRLAFRDRGVTVEPDGLSFFRDGVPARIAFADIRSVQLSLASTGRTPAGICTITCANGQKLVVATINASGLADPTGEGTYRRFIEALHMALVASGDSRHIGFMKGFSAPRRMVLFVGLLLGGALFVALPLILLLITRDLKVLLILIAGAGLLVPFVRIYTVNEPRSYWPTSPPDLLP